MDKRVIEKMYHGKKEYVEKNLAAALKPVRDFDSIEYARDPITNEEFVKLTETIGSAWFVNVTGYTKSEILKAICYMVLEKQPAGLIKTRDRMRDASALFR